MADTSAERVKKLVEGLRERANHQRDLLLEQFSAAAAGLERLNDDEFVVWVEERAAVDPLWLATRPYVAGGDALLRRYNKLKEGTDGAPLS